MQGLFIDGRRPKSKKEVKEAVTLGEVSRISVEATSLFGNEFDGDLASAPNGSIHFVGPDPYRARNFYGTITVNGGKITVK